MKPEQTLEVIPVDTLLERVRAMRVRDGRLSRLARRHCPASLN